MPQNNPEAYGKQAQGVRDQVLKTVNGGSNSRFRELAESLPPCRVEDDANCFWDAAVQGNGRGRSFIDVEGEVFYEDDEIPDFGEINPRTELFQRR